MNKIIDDRKEKILGVGGIKLESNIDKNLIKNKKEENGFHSLAIAPRQNLLSPKTRGINQNLYKYLSVDNKLTKLGSHSLVSAADLRSAVFQRHAGSNSLRSEMSFPPPASKILFGFLILLLSIILISNAYAATSIELTTGSFINVFGNLNLSGNNLINAGNVSIKGNLSVAGNLSVGNNVLFVDAAGNRVGVGTALPSDTLTIIGSLVAFGSLNATFVNATEIRVGGNIVQVESPAFKLSNYSSEYGSTGYKLSNFTSNLNSVNASISLWNGTTNIYPREITGNVGIGTTGPAATLHINSSSVKGALLVTNGSGSNYTAFFVNATLGRVGIGTTSPGAKLEIGDVITGYASTPQVMIVDAVSGEFEALTLFNQIAGGSTAENISLGFEFGVGDQGARRAGKILVGKESSYSTSPDSDSYMAFFTAQNAVNNERMRIDQSGNVGIGTTAPNYLLQVASGTDGRSVNLSNVLYVNGSSGNVGIGTASPVGLLHVGTASDSQVFVGATADPGWTVPALQLGDRDAIWRRAAQSLSISTNLYWDGVRKYVVTGTSMEMIIDDTDFIFRGAPSGTAGTEPTFTEIMRIDRGGNVGIGTTSPATSLHVVGNITSGPDAGTRHGLKDSNGASGMFFGSPAGNDIQFNTHDSGVVMTIDSSSGNVGIGDTGPSAKLEIAGTTTGLASFGHIYVRSTDSMAINKGGEIFFGGIYTGSSDTSWASIEGKKENGNDNDFSAYLAFGTRKNPNGAISERMRIDSSGNVGIGTASPGSRLEVENTASADDVLLLEDSSGLCEAQPSTTGLTWSCSSDEKLKEDIRNASSYLGYITTIPLFDYKVKKTGERVTGWIAQEMNKTHPELVRSYFDDKTNQTLLAVSEIPQPILIKAIQELTDRLQKVEQGKGLPLQTAGRVTEINGSVIIRLG